MAQENKKSFFIVKFKKYHYNDIDDSKDTFFEDLISCVEAKRDWFVFMTDTDVTIFFSRSVRARPKALSNILYNHLVTENDFRLECDGVSRDVYYTQLSYHRNTAKFRLVREPMIESYSAKDLEMFEDFENLYPWQQKLYNKIIDKEAESDFKIPDKREIMSIVDKKGKKGKSSFVKWLCYNYPMDIARLSFGTASQLRSAVFNMGKRKCYIIDLPRTKGKGDSIFDLLSVIEDIKNGFVSSSMYGGDRQLMMDPPFVIVFSNSPLPYSSLSEDRWDLYTLSNDKDLVKSRNLYSGEEEEQEIQN